MKQLDLMLLTIGNNWERVGMSCKDLWGLKSPSFLNIQAKDVSRHHATVQVSSISRRVEAGRILMMASDKLFTMFGLERPCYSKNIILAIFRSCALETFASWAHVVKNGFILQTFPGIKSFDIFNAFQFLRNAIPIRMTRTFLSPTLNPIRSPL